MASIEVWAEDRPQLGDGVLWENHILYDVWTNRKIEIQGKADDLISLCDGKRDVGDIVCSFQEKNKLNFQDAWHDVLSFLIDMDKAVLLQWRRNFSGMLKLNRLLFLLSQMVSFYPIAFKSNRVPPRVSRVIFAVILAYSPILLFAFLLSVGMEIVIVDQGVMRFGSFYHVASAFIPLLVAFLYLLPLIAHEVTHFVVAKILKLYPIAVRRGMKISVTYSSLTQRKKQIFVSLAGPFSGIVFSVVVAVVSVVILRLHFMVFVMFLSSIVHAYSILPWTADGRLLWKRQ